MANEISTRIVTTMTNPTSSTTAALLTAVFDKGPYLHTQTTQAVFADTVTVTTADTVISLPTSSKFTAALQGLFCAINLDPTNYVSLGPDNAGAINVLARLYPRTPVQIPIAPNVVVRWQANTATCVVMFVWLAK